MHWTPQRCGVCVAVADAKPASQGSSPVWRTGARPRGPGAGGSTSRRAARRTTAGAALTGDAAWWPCAALTHGGGEERGVGASLMGVENGREIRAMGCHKLTYSSKNQDPIFNKRNTIRRCSRAYPQPVIPSSLGRFGAEAESCSEAVHVELPVGGAPWQPCPEPKFWFQAGPRFVGE